MIIWPLLAYLERAIIKSIEPFEIKIGYLENLAGEAIHN